MLPTVAVSPTTPPVTVALPAVTVAVPNTLPVPPAVRLIAPELTTAEPVVATVAAPVAMAWLTMRSPATVLSVTPPVLPAGFAAVVMPTVLTVPTVSAPALT